MQILQTTQDFVKSMEDCWHQAKRLTNEAIKDLNELRIKEMKVNKEANREGLHRNDLNIDKLEEAGIEKIDEVLENFCKNMDHLFL